MKPCRRDIKILFALQQVYGHVRICAGNLIYGVRLQVNVVNRMAKKSFNALLHCSEKNLRIFILCWIYTLEKVGLNFDFSLASVKLNYSDILSFSNKLKFCDLHKAVDYRSRKSLIFRPTR